MIDTDLGIRGAKRATFKSANLRELALQVKNDNPNADRDQLRDLLVLAVKQHVDEGYVEACIEYACSNTVNSMLPREYSGMASPERVAEREKAKILAEKIVAEKLSSVVERKARQLILDIIMPNGKPMRDVTGTYLAKVNAGYAKIAKAAGSKKIGDVLSEKEARKLMN